MTDRAVNGRRAQGGSNAQRPSVASTVLVTLLIGALVLQIVWMQVHESLDLAVSRWECSIAGGAVWVQWGTANDVEWAEISGMDVAAVSGPYVLGAHGTIRRWDLDEDDPVAEQVFDIEAVERFSIDVGLNGFDSGVLPAIVVRTDGSVVAVDTTGMESELVGPGEYVSVGSLGDKFFGVDANGEIEVNPWAMAITKERSNVMWRDDSRFSEFDSAEAQVVGAPGGVVSARSSYFLFDRRDGHYSEYLGAVIDGFGQIKKNQVTDGGARFDADGFQQEPVIRMGRISSNSRITPSALDAEGRIWRASETEWTSIDSLRGEVDFDDSRSSVVCGSPR